MDFGGGRASEYCSDWFYTRSGALNILCIGLQGLPAMS